MNSDYQALLQAVLDTPDDDAPRLIMADLLDGMDQGIRAEFIRVSVELANTPEPELKTRGLVERSFQPVRSGHCGKCTWSSTGRCHYHTIEDRHNEILSSDWRPLAPEFPLLMTRVTRQILQGHAHVRWYRGFINFVEMTWEDCLKHLTTIMKQQPIKEVALTTWPELSVTPEADSRLVQEEHEGKIIRYRAVHIG